MNRPLSLNRRYLILYRCGVLIVAAMMIITACHSNPLIPIQPGTIVPNFSLEAAQGGTYQLQSLQGQAVLLSFIDSQTEASATPEPSRAQTVFLKSMFEQYSPQGVLVLIVDAACLKTGKQPARDDLINFTYDWQLDKLPVLIDDCSHSAAGSFGIKEVPTTFLIRPDGVLQQRWDGIATTAQISFAIQDLDSQIPSK